MLKNQTKKIIKLSNRENPQSIVPDPWESPISSNKTSFRPQTEKLFSQPQPSLASAGDLNAPILPLHKPTSAEIILEDELKLNDNLLEPKLEKALALIYWLETSLN